MCARIRVPASSDGNTDCRLIARENWPCILLLLLSLLLSPRLNHTFCRMAFMPIALFIKFDHFESSFLSFIGNSFLLNVFFWQQFQVHRFHRVSTTRQNHSARTHTPNAALEFHTQNCWNASESNWRSLNTFYHLRNVCMKKGIQYYCLRAHYGLYGIHRHSITTFNAFMKNMSALKANECCGQY